MILLIDNYDSFTYNLYQLVAGLGAEVDVRRNDEISVAEVRLLSPDRIIISPGPCTPAEAGISVPLVQELAGTFPILGVCLGHQAIGAAFGADVVAAPAIVHGKTSQITHDGTGLFQGMSRPFTATRYHSLVVDESTLPAEFEVQARAEDGLMMAMCHTHFELYGLQFHPESILTEHGDRLIGNFINAVGPVPAAHGY